jgi:hypothetical protein
MNVYRGAHTFVSGRTVSPLALILFGLSRKFGASRVASKSRLRRPKSFLVLSAFFKLIEKCAGDAGLVRRHRQFTNVAISRRQFVEDLPAPSALFPIPVAAEQIPCVRSSNVNGDMLLDNVKVGLLRMRT